MNSLLHILQATELFLWLSPLFSFNSLIHRIANLCKYISTLLVLAAAAIISPVCFHSSLHNKMTNNNQYSFFPYNFTYHVGTPSTSKSFGTLDQCQRTLGSAMTQYGVISFYNNILFTDSSKWWGRSFLMNLFEYSETVYKMRQAAISIYEFIHKLKLHWGRWDIKSDISLFIPIEWFEKLHIKLTKYQERAQRSLWLIISLRLMTEVKKFLFSFSISLMLSPAYKIPLARGVTPMLAI